MELISIVIVVLIFMISIRTNEIFMYLFEEYVYQKYYLNQEKEDEEYGTEVKFK